MSRAGTVLGNRVRTTLSAGRSRRIRDQGSLTCGSSNKTSASACAAWCGPRVSRRVRPPEGVSAESREIENCLNACRHADRSCGARSRDVVELIEQGFSVYFVRAQDPTRGSAPSAAEHRLDRRMRVYLGLSDSSVTSCSTKDVTAGIYTRKESRKKTTTDQAFKSVNVTVRTVSLTGRRLDHLRYDSCRVMRLPASCRRRASYY